MHHKKYTESNLLGENLNGLVAINHACHYSIEFFKERKCSLSEANSKLKQLKKTASVVSEQEFFNKCQGCKNSAKKGCTFCRKCRKEKKFVKKIFPTEKDWESLFANSSQ